MTQPIKKIAQDVVADFIAEWDHMDERARQGGADCFSYDDVRDRADTVTGGELDCTQLDLVADQAFKILTGGERKARAFIKCDAP